MDNQTEVVDVRLPNGLVVGVEVVKERGARDVSALDHLDFAHVQGVLDGLAQAGGSASLKVSLTWEHIPALGENAPAETSDGEPDADPASAPEPADGGHAD